jgi:hypothetical protein
MYKPSPIRKDFFVKYIRLSLVLCCVLFCFSACSSKQPNPDGRLDISGTITLNGGPLEGAKVRNIMFEPIDDPTSGPSTAVIDLQTGKFLCTMHDGLKPGKYRVKLFVEAIYDKRTNQPVGPDFGSTDDDDGQGYRVPLIPPDFNTQSTIEFEVASGKKNVFDYDIKAELKPQ